MSLLLPHDGAMTELALVRTFRFLLRPKAAQHLALERILEGQRLLYNAALQERTDAWRKQRATISCYDQMKSLTVICADDPGGYGALPSRLSRATLRRLDEAFKGFFRRVKSGQTPGFPRFKPMSRWDSFGFAEFKGVSFDGRRLRFKGMPGGLRVHVHRELPRGARILSCHLRRDAKGWNVSLQVRYRPEVVPHHGPIAGMDVGLEHLAVLSDGTFIQNPRIGAGRARHLRRLQRALQRTKKGSGNRAKRRRALALAHMAVANARETQLHQQSVKITRCYGTIVVEKLQIQELSASARGTIEQPGINVRARTHLNRSIQDAAWGRFLYQLRYKAESAGGRVIHVVPHHTSQLCSGCGTLVPKRLEQRLHRCTQCGIEIDRDLNAARNILQRGLAVIEDENSAARVADRGVVAPGRLNAGAVTASVPAEKSGSN
jgi:putative transposase